MTPQEQQMLDGLIDRIRNTQLNGKDQQAEQHIQQSLGNNPDALYILCQTVLVQGYALEQAQKQLNDLKQQQDSSQGHQPGFLEKIFGSGDRQQSQGQAQPAQPQYGQPQAGYGGQVYSGQPGYGQPGYAQQPYPPQGYPQQSGGFGGGGFLQGAMQTAAGVAMGTLAVQGIEGLLSGFGHAAGYGSDRALGGFGDDHGRGFADSGSDSGDNFGDRLQAADHASPGLSSDIEDRRGDGFLGNSGGDNGDASAFEDSATDTGYDNASDISNDDLSDNSGYDDGGSFSDDN